MSDHKMVSRSVKSLDETLDLSWVHVMARTKETLWAHLMESMTDDSWDQMKAAYWGCETVRKTVYRMERKLVTTSVHTMVSPSVKSLDETLGLSWVHEMARTKESPSVHLMGSMSDDSWDQMKAAY